MVNNELYEREEYQDFADNLKAVAMHMFYNMEHHNNIIDYLSSLPTDDAIFICDLCNDFYISGREYGMPQFGGFNG